MTRVVTGAQYASGKRASRAAPTEATAAMAVREEWITIGQSIQSRRRFATRLRVLSGIRPLQLLVSMANGMSVIRKRVERRGVEAEPSSMPPNWMQLRRGMTLENAARQNGKRA